MLMNTSTNLSREVLTLSEYEAKQLIESDPELKAELMKMRQLPKEFKLTELGNAERFAKFGVTFDSVTG